MLLQSLKGGWELGSDEGNPYRNSGRVSPVQGGVVGHNVLHHGVFGHVLHKVGLLERRETWNFYIPLRLFEAHQTEEEKEPDSLRCTPGRTCCSRRPWHFWWRVQTGGSAARPSLNRHGNNWSIWRVCPYCAASDETFEKTKTKKKAISLLPKTSPTGPSGSTSLIMGIIIGLMTLTIWQPCDQTLCILLSKEAAGET